MRTSTFIVGGLVVWAGFELWKNHNLKATLNAMKADVSNLKNSVMKLKDASTEEQTASAPKPSCSMIANAGVVEPTTPIRKDDSAWSNLFGRTMYNEVLTPSCSRQLKNYNISCNTDRLRARTGTNEVFRADGWGRAWM